MRIIQITDIHIPAKGEETYGIDVHQNFLDSLQKAKSLEPDHLVISGDLCNIDGDRETYEWVKARLELVDIPYSLLVGNHDDGGLMSEVFGLSHLMVNGELFYKYFFGNQSCLFLDTGRHLLSEQQLEWLANELRVLQGDVLIFMHHPPLFGGVPFMDNKYALQNRTAVQKILFNHINNIHIFCGHYHVDKVLHQNNVTVYITPSTYFQIDQHSEEFKVDHKRIGLREIVIEDGYMSTAVHYV